MKRPPANGSGRVRQVQKSEHRHAPARGQVDTTVTPADGATMEAAIRSGAIPARAVSRLQHRLGNRRLTGMLAQRYQPVRRVPLTPEEREQNLMNAPYADNERLEQVFDNDPMMRRGEEGEAVALVQQGLLDDGVLLPLSTENGTAPPDGIFGPETAQGVREFQERNSLQVDGIIGRETMGHLDLLAPTRRPPGGEVEPTGPEPEIPPLSTPEFIIDVLQRADADMLNRLRRDGAFLDGIQELMSPEEFGRAAACFCLVMPDDVQNPAESKTEALRIMAAQMAGDKATTRRALERVRGMVIPANRLATDYAPFDRLRGTDTGDGRTWDTVRGIGNTPLGELRYSSMPEENLLGIPCTATYTPTSGPNAGVPQSLGEYPEGYSVATHEFAHSLQGAALTEDDNEAIQDAYDERKTAARADPTNTNMWVDGREGCYASANVAEFYAQLSNAYLGTNGGTDATTGDTRHNGKAWVLAHEPEVYAILERVYAGSELEGTNPTSAPLVGGGETPTPEGAAGTP